MRKQVVIARYMEDLSWIFQIPEDWEITIYNKGPVLTDSYIDSLRAKGSITWTQLENVGREGDTFLTHIINNHGFAEAGEYKLADVTVFLQGNPQDHLQGAWSGGEGRQDLAEVLSREDWNTYSVWGLGDWLECDQVGGPHHVPPQLPLVNMSEMLGLPIGKRIPFVVGAQWLVGRNVIAQHEKLYYEHIRNLVRYDPVWGYCLERMWAKIFTVAKTGVLYYSHHSKANPILPPAVRSAVIDQIRTFAGRSTTKHAVLTEVDKDAHVFWDIEAPARTGQYNVDIYKAIERGLESFEPGTLVFLAEHDVLYPADYWAAGRKAHRPGHIGYANNIFFLNAVGYWTYRPSTFQSTCFGERNVLLKEIRARLKFIDDNEKAPAVFDLGRSPEIPGALFEYTNENPVLDIRYKTQAGENTTPTGTADKAHPFYRNIPYWGSAAEQIERLGLTEDHGFRVISWTNYPSDSLGTRDIHLPQ